MFDSFETRTIPGEGAEIFCRIGGSGTPLLLLHGYPETGAMWAAVAERLAERFTVVVPDLRGYGRSSNPESRAGDGYTKRVMARDMVAVMEALGHTRFFVAGHDRGGRVAYRMALDSPERVGRLALLDMVPTVAVWEAMDDKAAMKTYHWPFLAQPNPMPERLIAADPVFYLDHTIASWTKSRSLSAFSSEALAEYRKAFSRAETVHAACEDYRAGATIDRADDEADRAAGRRIACPTLAIWGSAGVPAGKRDPLSVWREWCDSVEGHALDAGHFLAEEAPEETATALADFFGR